MGFEASYQGVLVCTFILKRLCSPLLPTPSLYISQDQKIKKWEEKKSGNWTRRESNTQPSDLESDALPLRHGSTCYFRSPTIDTKL